MSIGGSRMAATRELRITIYQEYPPIPMRTFDWCAWISGEETGIVSWGSTSFTAVKDLIMQLEENEN